jgi:DNA-binding transcriptional MerR regulator
MDHLEGFQTEVAAKLGGVTVDMLANWDRTGFLSPSVPAKRRGISRRYSFRDLVAVRVAAQLRAEGIPLQALRKVVAYLCARTGLSPTEALAATNLVTDGQDVHEVTGEASISTLRRPGQRMLLMVPLDAVVTELQARARALRAA